MVLIYGKPIEIKDFLPLYLENPAIGLNTIRAALATALSAIMLDIRSQDYDRTYRLCCYGVPAYLDYLAEKGIRTEAETMAGLRFDARVALAKLFDRLETEDLESLLQMDALTLKLNQLPGYPAEIMEWMEETPTKTHQFLLAFIAVVLLPGFALNLPSWLINRLIVSNVEDKQMHGTFVFTLGMAFNLVVYLAVTILVGNLLSATLWQMLLLLFFIGSLGIVSEKARQYLRLPFRKWRYSFGKRKAFVNACKTDYLQLRAMIGKMVFRMES